MESRRRRRRRGGATDSRRDGGAAARHGDPTQPYLAAAPSLTEWTPHFFPRMLLGGL